jgi:hypothetical protein
MPIDNDIKPGITFIGYIPPNSNKEHLGIVIISDDLSIHYCYCTSKSHLSRYITNYVKIEKDVMKKYFPNVFKDTYIYITPDRILSMLYITFKDRITTGEFTLREPIDKGIFNEVITKILSIDVITDSIKQELRKLL